MALGDRTLAFKKKEKTDRVQFLKSCANSKLCLNTICALHRKASLCMFIIDVKILLNLIKGKQKGKRGEEGAYLGTNALVSQMC